jgi:DNA-binding response OmpR family regulator
MKNNELLGRLRVLYAEDSLPLREKIGEKLLLLVGEVVIAQDGLEALELYRRDSFDILILDNRMPGMTGREVAQTIRDEGDNVPIFFITSVDNTNELMECVTLSLTDYILKPITDEKLEEALNRCLKRLGSYTDISSQKNVCEGVVYDFAAKGIIVDSTFIQLTKYQYRLVELLLSKNEKEAYMHEIENVVYGGNMSIPALRNNIKRIRDKTGLYFIESVQNIGYKIACR